MSANQRLPKKSDQKASFRAQWNRHDPRVGTIFILAFSLVAASISRLPLLDQFAEVKIGIFGAELLSAILLFVAVRQRDVARTFIIVAAILVVFRLAIGAMLANFAFGQPFEISVQESRFGLMLIISPITFLFLKESSSALLKRFVSCYMLVLLTLDILVYFVFNVDDLLILGLRTDNRFFCSILVPLVSIAVLLVRQHIAGDKKQSFVLAMTIGMLFHSVLVTTSRAETLLAAGLLGFILYRRWPLARWALYLLALVVILIISLSTTNSDEGVAGRDYSLAIDLAWKALPFGFGAVIDPTAKSVLGLPENFFLSDYGLLLYVLRYGLFGVITALLLLLLWMRFELGARRLKGHLLLTAPVLIYLTIVPLLDYGSLNGGFLLALMCLVPLHIKSSSLRH